jgi:hypothetical protein
MKQDQYDKLSKHAHDMQKISREQVAVADLIREAIDVYIEVLDEESGEDQSI